MRFIRQNRNVGWLSAPTHDGDDIIRACGPYDDSTVPIAHNRLAVAGGAQDLVAENKDWRAIVQLDL